MISKRLVVCISIALSFIFPFTGIASATNLFPEQQAEQSIKKAITYLRGIQNDDGGFPTQKGRDSSRAITAWVIMALAAAGEDVAGSRWSPSGQSPIDFLKNCKNSLESTGDYAVTLLALTAARQGNAYQGVNLAGKIASFQQTGGQFAQPARGEQGLINYHMWSVLALASTGQDIPNKERAKEWLLARQNKDGGFGWAEGINSDPDDTAVAIQTLVVLGEDPQSSPAIRGALNYLKSCREEDGGFSWEGNKSNSATDAWVLQGLFAAGENPASEEWSVNGKNAVTHLFSLQNSDGSFNWMPDVRSSPVMMTAYAVMALAKKPFPVNIEYGAGKTELPGGGIFSDISTSHWAHSSIMELVKEKVLSGYPGGTFKPGNPVTRAEFAKFMVYGLGYRSLESDSALRFKDVSESYWANRVISIAVDMGYVKGKPGGVFDPGGNITGGELAAMLVRALPPEKQVKVEAGSYWYSGSVQLAGDNGLLYPGFDARAQATRAQCAYSITRLRNLLK
ncbi:S-layer homology domain-containing protein [Desulfoscipio geothermicus]|uniref:SLH domain-containing protein n=1 Tax=Desulfoscipio geothermicus DSM 3669 TaxID=1121426 RepID=A0A1I6D745_9FIRM|nr:S-layer homology domain-containing protein [Desulfoscipio geothermicus]SFR01201.1 hypothetical protein SAMN05660706_10686 [Desulfoscipio geothermicus DSM 3669]